MVGPARVVPDRLRFRPPRLHNVVKPLGQLHQKSARDAANGVLRRFVRDVFNRRLAVNPRQQKGRKQPRRPSFDRVGRLPVNAAEVASAQRIERRMQLRVCRRNPHRLQQQVIEAEGQIERWIAEPGAFRVEEHRARRSDQDVLRADVAVHHA